MHLSVSLVVLAWSFLRAYGWQAVFITFGALAIDRAIWIKECSKFKINPNIFGVVFALLFCIIFISLYPRIKVKRSIIGYNEVISLFDIRTIQMYVLYIFNSFGYENNV